MNKRKVYIPPYSEVVLVNGQICESAHQVKMSGYDLGDGEGVKPIDEGHDEGDAKGWDLWDDFDASNW